MKLILKKKNENWGKSQLGAPRVHTPKAPYVPPKEPVVAKHWTQMVDASTKQRLARTPEGFLYWQNMPSTVDKKGKVTVVLGNSGASSGKTI